MTPDEARALLAACPAPWWVAGGHAIELFVGRRVRDHDDLDLGCFRDAWPLVRRALPGWDCRAVKDGQRTPLTGDAPPAHTQTVWCRPPGDETPWALEFLLEDGYADGSGAMWRFRRDPRVRRAADALTFHARGGLTALRPEIQLLYKAKHLRPKDEEDFAAAAPAMPAADRAWLREALAIAHPGHPWAARLV